MVMVIHLPLKGIIRRQRIHEYHHPCRLGTSMRY
jgi:hypothetical protein